jgi:hypothetical protein
MMVELPDERGVLHVITQRNQRMYFGRVVTCACGTESSFVELPWACSDCGNSIPKVLRSRPSDWWDQPMLARTKVLVIGCGALGNEVVKNLALTGVGNFTLVDFDTIEEHNLNRSILFHESARKASPTTFKVDVMAEAIRMIDPGIHVNTLKTGVLDPRSQNRIEQTGVRWPDPPLDIRRLQELGLEHDICLVLTDGLAPKVFASRHLYHVLPIVQGAMNTTGTNGGVRVSLPLTTSCIICPSLVDPVAVHVDSDGVNTDRPDWRAFEDDVGENPCRFAAAATGALSFAHTNALVGGAVASQCLFVLHGWRRFAESGYREWPKAVPVPLWNEAAQLSPSDPGGYRSDRLEHRYIPIPRGTTSTGDLVCYNCRTGAPGTAGPFSFRWMAIQERAEAMVGDMPIHLKSTTPPPRVGDPKGSPKPTFNVVWGDAD